MLVSCHSRYYIYMYSVGWQYKKWHYCIRNLLKPNINEKLNWFNMLYFWPGLSHSDLTEFEFCSWIEIITFTLRKPDTALIHGLVLVQKYS